MQFGTGSRQTILNIGIVRTTQESKLGFKFASKLTRRNLPNPATDRPVEHENAVAAPAITAEYDYFSGD